MADGAAPPVSAERVNSDLFECERALIGAPNELIESCLKRLMDVLSPPRADASASERIGEWWRRNRAIYISAVSDLPADLVTIACRRLLRSARFMPKPAEIREAVSEEFVVRQQTRLRLQLALSRAKATAPVDREIGKRTAEDMAGAAAEAQRVRDILNGVVQRACDLDRGQVTLEGVVAANAQDAAE